MAKNKTHLENNQVVMSEPGRGICLNNQTTTNLIKYLKQFPKDSKVTIWHDYKTFDCQICCNFEHQDKTKTAQLMLGLVIDSEA